MRRAPRCVGPVAALASLALAAACAGSPAAVQAPVAPAPAPAPAEPGRAGAAVLFAPAPAPRTPPSEAAITKLSQDVLDAYDRGDVPALEAALAPELVHFEGGQPSSRDDELAALRKRKPGAPHIATRTWDKVSVRAFADSAVYVGRATEQQGGNESKGGYKFVGWYLLEWVRAGAGDDWKLRVWTWHRGGEQSKRDTWNEIFRNGLGYEKAPNKLLVETIQGKRPGTALDVAMGQGRNALHLASLGWKTTGVDISDEGIRLARAEAEKRKLALETVNADIDKYDFGKNKWDLVTMIYAGDDAAWIEKIKPSLKKGGLFIVEYFAKTDDKGPNDGGFAAGQLAKLFADGFEILRDEVVEGVPDWALDKAQLVRFVAKKK
jgi:SAM-dependent methyltransferase